ncbi:hypothetical protein AYI68_g5971 [Smittium mucronatum]|uniref:Transcription factor domain-containing protein n=1 Tax=Smittium mucronatum TaxID=133383 RepID=A0A1R0GST3_9FUNG|nr:hypothetical protein AYI68_g5971 [Smittium mucronatum]
MIPACVPDFLKNLKNESYPNYFFYAFLSIGSKYMLDDSFPNKASERREYGKFAYSLIKQEKDNNSPMYIWACLLLSLNFWLFFDETSTLEVMALIPISYFRAVISSRLYMMDNKPKHISRQNTHELEFERRVFWSFYILIRYRYVFGPGFVSLHDRDISVLLPSKDFTYRYGPTQNYPKEGIPISSLVNTSEFDLFKQDIASYTIKIMSLFGRIAIFTKCRWLKKNRFDKSYNNQFLPLKNSLSQLKKYLSIHYPDTNFNGRDFTIPGISRVMNEDLDYKVAKYLDMQMLHNITIFLFQSELVKIKDLPLDPERIRIAKIECLRAAMHQAELLSLEKVIGLQVEDITATSHWKVNTIITLLNVSFVEYNHLGTNASEAYNSLLKVYDSLKSDFLTAEIISNLFSNIYQIKRKSIIKNEKNPQLQNKMKLYSITEADLNPWFVPKYSLLFSFNCCFSSNYSTLDSSEYLEIPSSALPTPVYNKPQKSSSKSRKMRVSKIKPPDLNNIYKRNKSFYTFKSEIFVNNFFPNIPKQITQTENQDQPLEAPKKAHKFIPIPHTKIDNSYEYQHEFKIDLKPGQISSTDKTTNKISVGRLVDDFKIIEKPIIVNRVSRRADKSSLESHLRVSGYTSKFDKGENHFSNFIYQTPVPVGNKLSNRKAKISNLINYNPSPG